MVCAADITGYFVMVMFGFVHTQEIVGLSHISHDPITTVILSSQGQHQTKVWLSHVHAEHVDAQPARHSRLDADDGGAAGGEEAGPGEIPQHPPGDLQGEPWRGESQYNAMMECDLTQINLVNWFLFPLWSETFPSDFLPLRQPTELPERLQPQEGRTGQEETRRLQDRRRLQVSQSHMSRVLTGVPQLEPLLELAALLLCPAAHTLGQEVADGPRHRRPLRQPGDRWGRQ